MHDKSKEERNNYLINDIVTAGYQFRKKIRFRDESSIVPQKGC